MGEKVLIVLGDADHCCTVVPAHRPVTARVTVSAKSTRTGGRVSLVDRGTPLAVTTSPFGSHGAVSRAASGCVGPPRSKEGWKVHAAPTHPTAPMALTQLTAKS